MEMTVVRMKHLLGETYEIFRKLLDPQWAPGCVDVKN
jgi:hypothetical protein